MVNTLLSILGAGLSLWDSKEKTKYQDKYLKLRKRYFDEEKKERPDHAVLDNLEFELYELSESFAAEVARSKVTLQ